MKVRNYRNWTKNLYKGHFLGIKNIVWHLFGIFMQQKFIPRHKKYILYVFMIILNFICQRLELSWYQEIRPCLK